MPSTTTSEDVQNKDQVEAPAETKPKTRVKRTPAKADAKTPAKAKTNGKDEKAKKVPAVPYFRTLGENKDLALVLEGLDQPVRRGSWAAMVALLLLDQGADATEESIAKAWEQAAVKNGETYPGRDGLYHTDGNDHAQKTVLASTTYGARKALRLLHNRGLISAEAGKPIVIKTPLKQFVGKVTVTVASKPKRQVRRPRPDGQTSDRKGRTSRAVSK